METIDLKKYFDGTDYEYLDAYTIVYILEDILGKKLKEIKSDVFNSQISITKEQIIEFLDKKFEEENPEVKQRLNEQKQVIVQKDENKPKLTSMQIEINASAAAQRFGDRLTAGKYQFEPYTLEYFERYTAIVKNKALQLLNIIEFIGSKQTLPIQKELEDLDIQLDERGNITKEDITRLIIPTIQNIDSLNKKTTQANDVSTYLTYKVSKHSLNRDGWSESELYPHKSLLVKDLYYGYSKGNVPISNRQQQELEEKQKQQFERIAKIMIKIK